MLATSTLQTFRRVGEGLLQRHELGQVVIVERVGLAHVAAGVELVEPDLAGRRALLEEQHHRLHARALERAAGAVEHRVQVAAFQQQLAQAHRGVVGVREERVLDDDAAAPAGLQHLDEVLEEQERRLAGADGEVLLHLLALLAAEGRIGQHHVVAVLVLNVGEVLGQRVGVDDVRRLDAVQDHVHDRDDVGEATSSPCRRRCASWSVLRSLGGQAGLRLAGSRTPRTGSPPSPTRRRRCARRSSACTTWTMARMSGRGV